MPNLRTIAITAAALALGAPGVAAADSPWAPPSPIHYGSTSAVLGGAPQLAANAAGLAVAIANFGGSGEFGPHTDVSVFTNGVFLDPYQLSAANIAYGPGNGQIAAYGATRLVAAGVQRARDSAQAVFAFGRLTPNKATLDAARPLGPTNMHAGGSALAVNDAGDVAMVYPVCRDAGCRKALVYLAVRKHGTSAISSTRLFDGGGPLPRVAVAVNTRGDALAVWTAAGKVQARVRTLGGTLRGTQAVGSIERGSQIAPSAALSTHRGELIGWLSQRVSEGDGGQGGAFVTQARDGGRFSTATKLTDIPGLSGVTVGGAGVRVAFDALGRRLALWTGYESDHFVARSAEVLGAANSGRADLTDPVLISDPAVDTILAGMVLTASGQQVVTLEAGVRGDQPVNAASTVAVALRAAGGKGPFSVEAVSDGKSYAIGAGSAVAGTGRIITAWTTLAGGDLFSQRLGKLP